MMKVHVGGAFSVCLVTERLNGIGFQPAIGHFNVAPVIKLNAGPTRGGNAVVDVDDFQVVDLDVVFASVGHGDDVIPFGLPV